MKNPRKMSSSRHLATAVATLFLFTLATEISAAATPWKAGPSTREMENGAVLANDLIFVEGTAQAGPRYYPQAAVFQWDPVTQPGRYRATLRARTEKFGDSTLVLQAWVRRQDGGEGIETGYGVIPTAVASISILKTILTKR